MEAQHAQQMQPMQMQQMQMQQMQMQQMQMQQQMQWGGPPPQQPAPTAYGQYGSPMPYGMQSPGFGVAAQAGAAMAVASSLNRSLSFAEKFAMAALDKGATDVAERASQQVASIQAIATSVAGAGPAGPMPGAALHWGMQSPNVAGQVMQGDGGQG